MKNKLLSILILIIAFNVATPFVTFAQAKTNKTKAVSKARKVSYLYGTNGGLHIFFSDGTFATQRGGDVNENELKTHYSKLKPTGKFKLTKKGIKLDNNYEEEFTFYYEDGTPDESWGIINFRRVIFLK